MDCNRVCSYEHVHGPSRYAAVLCSIYLDKEEVPFGRAGAGVFQVTTHP